MLSLPATGENNFINTIRDAISIYEETMEAGKKAGQDPEYLASEYYKQLIFYQDHLPRLERQLREQMIAYYQADANRPVEELAVAVNDIVKKLAEETPPEESNHLLEEVEGLEAVLMVYIDGTRPLSNGECLAYTCGPDGMTPLIDEHAIQVFSSSIDLSRIRSLHVRSSTDRTYYYRATGDGDYQIIVKITVPAEGQPTVEYFATPTPPTPPTATETPQQSSGYVNHSPQKPKQPEGVVGAWYSFSRDLRTQEEIEGNDQGPYTKGYLALAADTSSGIPEEIYVLSLEANLRQLNATADISSNGIASSLVLKDKEANERLNIGLNYKNFTNLVGSVEIPGIAEFQVSTSDFETADWRVGLPINLRLFDIQGTTSLAGTFGEETFKLENDYSLASRGKFSNSLHTSTTFSPDAFPETQIDITTKITFDENRSFSVQYEVDTAADAETPACMWFLFQIKK